MKRLILLATAVWLICSAAFAAPDITCTGTVVDEQNEPLIGATVKAVGTKASTATNIDGAFKLTVPAGTKTIQITFVGYKPVDLTPAANLGTITMETEALMLNDVVITQSVGKTRETPVALSTTRIQAR